MPWVWWLYHLLTVIAAIDLDSLVYILDSSSQIGWACCEHGDPVVQQLWLPELWSCRRFRTYATCSSSATIQVIQVSGSTSSHVRLRRTSTTTCWVRCQLSEDHPWSNYHEVTHGCEIEPARPGRFQTSDALKLGRPEMVSKTEKEKTGHRCWQVWMKKNGVIFF